MLKNMLCGVVDDIIWNVVVPLLLKILAGQISELARKIADAEKAHQECNKTFYEILNIFKSNIAYFYTGVIDQGDNEETRKLKVALEKLYRKDLPTMFDDLYMRMVRARCEVQDNDEYSMMEKQAKIFEAGTIAPAGDIKVWIPIVNELCKWCVAEYHDDATRAALLDEYLLHIKKIIEHVVNTTAFGIPGMHQLLSEYCAINYEQMVDKFREYDDRIYECFRGTGPNDGLVSFNRLTASVDEPEGKRMITANADGIEVTDEDLDNFNADVMVYMQAFTNKAKSDTDVLFRYDAVMVFMRHLDNQIVPGFLELLEASDKYDEETVAMSEKTKEATELLKKLKEEKSKLDEFHEELKKAASERHEIVTPVMPIIDSDQTADN